MRRSQFSKSGRMESGSGRTRIRAWRRGRRTSRRSSRGYRIARSGRSSRPSSSCAPSNSTDSRSSSCSGSVHELGFDRDARARDVCVGRSGRRSGASRRAPRSRSAGSSESSPRPDTWTSEGTANDAVYRARGPLPAGDPDRAEAAARAIDPGLDAGLRGRPRDGRARAARSSRGEKTRRRDPLLARDAAPLVRLLLERQPALPDQQPPRRGGRRRASCRRRAGPSSSRSAAAPGSAALALGERLARDGALARVGTLRLHRDRPDVSPPGRARDPRALPGASGRVPAAGHGPRLRRARASPAGIRRRRLRRQHRAHRPRPRRDARAHLARR